MKDIENLTGRLLGDPEGQAAPPIRSAKPQRPYKEYKSRRMQFLVKPSTAERLEAAAAEEGLSMNELVNRLMEEYLQGR